MDEVAALLLEQRANPFRVRGAETVRHLPQPVNEIVEHEGLKAYTHCRALAAVYSPFATAYSGGPCWRDCAAEAGPLELLQTVSDIGPGHAQRLHDDLGVDSLEELEADAHDGRLLQFAGLGHKRISGIMDSLATCLGRLRPPPPQDQDQAPVKEILDVDREYRQRAQAGELHKSRLDASMRRAKSGSPSSTLSAATGTTQRCSPIWPALTRWEKRMTG